LPSRTTIVLKYIVTFERRDAVDGSRNNGRDRWAELEVESITVVCGDGKDSGKNLSSWKFTVFVSTLEVEGTSE
jgi:hypothetical protein